MKSFLAAMAATLLALACGTEPPSNVTGTWIGTSDDKDPTAIEILLKDDDGTLSGSIKLSNDDIRVSGTVSGTYVDPDVTINIMVVIEGDTVVAPPYKGKRTGDDRIEGRIEDPEDPVMLDLVRER